jgi:hypothetical protein
MKKRGTGSVIFLRVCYRTTSHEKRGIKWYFYTVCPKYDFIYYEKSGVYFRENTITGEIDLQYMGQGEVTFWKAKKPFILF